MIGCSRKIRQIHFLHIYDLNSSEFCIQLRNARNILRHEPAILARCFSKDTGGCDDRGDGLLSTKQPGHLLGKRDGRCNLPLGSTSGSNKSFNYSSQANNLGLLKTSWTEFKGDFRRTVTQMGIPMFVMGLNRASTCLEASSRRCFSSDSDLPPHEVIGMPSLSPTMSEGNIARWLKKVGDKVSPGEVLCEIETDKATVEMECMEDGYLAKIIHDNGTKDIKVGEVIAITVEDENDIAKFEDYRPSSGAPSLKEATVSSPPTKEESQPTSVGSPVPKTTKVDESCLEEDRVFASSLARKLAEDHNVPVSSIKGTGPDGRIVKADIEDYLGSKGTTPVSEYSDIPHSQIRKVTASRLVLSKQTIPHYYLTVDTCVDKLMNLRSQLNFVQEASGSKRISVNDLVIKAAALALHKVPQCNSSWMNDYIRQYHNVNINIAVQTDNGLFVPVIRDADKKGLSQIAEEVKHLAQKAKDNCLKPEDYEGGTFTVSNLGGPFGIKQFSAIINTPQSAILAIGSAEKRVIPGVGPDQFEFASYMSIALSCDHRVIDGAIGAEYLKAFKGYIENPHSMLL